MRAKHWLIVVLAILAFLGTLALFLPASLIASHLPPNVVVTGLSGTVWNGAAESVAFDGRQLGSLQWRVHAMQLLSGRAAAHASLAGEHGHIAGEFALSSGQKLDADGLQAQWLVASLPIRAVPRGWTGSVKVDAPLLRTENTALLDVRGTIDLLDLRRNEAAMGSYRVTFDDTSRQGDQLIGRLQDLGGPLRVTGTVRLSPGNYAIDGLVAANPDAPREIADGLRYLGTPDAEGRRPFSVAGEY